MNKIDFSFISKLEGGQKLVAYVPAAGDSKSGVTVATGFDLGARNEHDLKRLGFTPILVNKLKPYLGLKKLEAENFLKKNPFSISKPEADTIDKAAKGSVTTKLTQDYNRTIKPPLKIFALLPAEAQTVIASVFYQYGDLAVKAPKFWKFVTSQDWKGTYDLLNNFQDRHTTRRKKEAAELKKIIK